MARPKKKPQYKSETIMKELLAAVVELYLDSGENVSIRQIADEFGMTPLKIRKLLITAGVFSSDVCDQVLGLFRSGKSVPEIQRITGLSRASVHSYSLSKEYGSQFTPSTRNSFLRTIRPFSSRIGFMVFSLCSNNKYFMVAP